MHADQTENFSLAYFGNEAEKSYYNEYLVCGQANPKPSPLDSLNYKAFEMKNNRCCREVGSDLTTYTSYIPLNLKPNYATNDDTSTTNDEYLTNSYGLKMYQAAGIAPNDKYRYSRLATVEDLGTASRPALNASQDRTASTLAAINPLNTTGNVMTPYQWKTLGEANSEGCCGGGWIRKFSDGGNDWTRRDRVYMDVKNFACINSRTPLLTHPEDFATQYDNVADVIALVNKDYGDYCQSSAGLTSACAQFSISTSALDTAPVVPATQFTSNHLKTNGMIFSSTTYDDFYFYPRSADSSTAVIMDFTNASGRRNISIKLPSYLPRTAFDYHYAAKLLFGTSAQRRDGSGAGYGGLYSSVVELYDVTDVSVGGSIAWCTIPTLGQLTALQALSSPTMSNVTFAYCNTGEGCCHSYDPATRILNVIPSDPLNPMWTGKKVGVKISNGYPAGGAGLSSILPRGPRTLPGTSTYYLKRLGLLELSGIPQITYKPLACNDNSNRLVPGIFKKTGVTDMKVNPDFIDDAYSYSATDPTTSLTSRYTNVHGLDHEAVFSENDFKCCTPLGSKTTTKSKCCSSFGNVAADGVTYTCALPAGTDLMVYFNRFVSNEGRGSTQPGGGLLDADFNQLTGEPIISTTVTQKISSLGSAYCSALKVRQGGAFGSYDLEPDGNNTNQNEKLYGILDSSKDEGIATSANPGYTAFMAGFRWNHHLYCDD
jgi:hypothetical protein